jgi:hypothetical protein
MSRTPNPLAEGKPDRPMTFDFCAIDFSANGFRCSLEAKKYNV